MKKLMFGMIICVIMALVLLPVSAAFAGIGTGDPSNPYETTTAAQLDEVRDDLTTHYKLISDIDLSKWNNPSHGTDPSYINGEGWEPIGDYSDPFNGTFDGAGHIITSLFIDRTRSTTDDIGLFGGIGSSGTVKNLGVVGGSVTGTGTSTGTIYVHVGGVVRWNDGEITDCYNTGKR